VDPLFIVYVLTCVVLKVMNKPMSGLLVHMSMTTTGKCLMFTRSRILFYSFFSGIAKQKLPKKLGNNYPHKLIKSYKYWDLKYQKTLIS